MPYLKLNYTLLFPVYSWHLFSSFDGTVVTTLLTLIASELHAVSNISWIATAYLLSSAAFQPIFGKLSDIFGRKHYYLDVVLCLLLGVPFVVLLIQFWF